VTQAVLELTEACLFNNPTPNFTISAIGSNTNFTISGTTSGIFNDPNIGIIVYRAGTDDFGRYIKTNSTLPTNMIITNNQLTFANSDDNWSTSRTVVYNESNGTVEAGYSYEAAAYHIPTGTISPCLGSRSNIV